MDFVRRQYASVYPKNVEGLERSSMRPFPPLKSSKGRLVKYEVVAICIGLA
jgi:hypothetical protein